MKKLLIVVVVVFFSYISSLNASVREDEAHHNTHGHKHSYGIYKQIDDLKTRKVVEKKVLKKERILEIAKAKLAQLIKDKKISKSYKSVKKPVMADTKVRFVHDYMVVFHNPKIKKKKYQTLYIFVDEYGEVKGVNYTGK